MPKLINDMYKVKHLTEHRVRAITALLVVIGVALVSATSAAAATVTHTILLTDESESFYACSFPLTATFTGCPVYPNRDG
jgi:hypothetical protein